MDSKEFNTARAVLAAAKNLGLDLKTYNSSAEVQEAWKTELAGAGLDEKGQQNVIDVEVAGFERELLNGKFPEIAAEATKFLVDTKEMTQAEVDTATAGLEELKAAMPAEAPKKVRAASAPKAPPEPKEVPLGIEVGDVVQVVGPSWVGFDALVVSIDQLTGQFNMYTQFKNGKEYRGRVRFDRVEAILFKGLMTWEKLAEIRTAEKAAAEAAKPKTVKEVQPPLPGTEDDGDPDPGDNEEGDEE